MLGATPSPAYGTAATGRQARRIERVRIIAFTSWGESHPDPGKAGGPSSAHQLRFKYGSTHKVSEMSELQSSINRRKKARDASGAQNPQ
jgi:hypothetical protein